MPPVPNNKTNTITPEQISPAIPAQGQRPRRRRWGFLAFLVLWVILLALIANKHQAISDWWLLRGYQPPDAIARLADQDTMTGYTRHLFYLNKPQLLSMVASFRKDCPENEDTIVLGCYHPNQQGIFIYNVQDQSLSGVTQVTAAHEALHAIYGRLSDKQRAYVNGLLNDYYEHGLTDQQVKAEIALYKKTEPHDVTDEMNSTFGTEIAHLPPALEAYYKQYFTNRAAIVAYEQQYDEEFTTRQATITADDMQLAAMKQQITDQEASLSNQLNSLNTQRAQLDSLLASGNAAAYNDGADAYNAQVAAYNGGIKSLQAAITQYNQLVAARNNVAGELTTLDKAVDTRLMPQAAR